MSDRRLSVESVQRRERLARAGEARAHRARGAGLLLVVLGVALVAGGFLVFLVLWIAGVDTGSLPGLAGTLTLPVSLALVTRGRRMRVGGAERLLASDARPPIVYLRPFDADSAKIERAWRSRLRLSPLERFENTYEERLARTLRRAGPFVAVGDPTERLPVLGAARLYAADTDWQETVGQLTARAGVLVLHAGASAGVAWELQYVIALGAPERVVLSLPLSAKRKQPSRQERYDVFVERFGDEFPRPLPAVIGDCQFAYFEADWTPRLLGARGAPPPVGEASQVVALRRLAKEFKITWAPLWVRMLVYGTVVLAPATVLVGLTSGGA